MRARTQRIAHVITGLSVGGAETMLERLVTGLMDRGHEQIVVSLRDVGVIGSRLRAAGVEVVALEMTRGISSVQSLWRLGRLLREFRPAVIQTWLYHADFAGLLVAPWVGKAHLCWNIRCSSLGTDYPSRMTHWLVALLAKASRCPDAIVVNSTAGLEDHRRLGYRPKRWALIGNGFDTQHFSPDHELRRRFREEFALSEDLLVVGLVARYHPMKDHRNFLLAASRITREVPSARFLLVGDGASRSNNELTELVHELGLDEFVILAGGRQDMPSVYCALDLAVSSSAYGEGFPNTLGEAMACGVPCVATDVGESKFLIGEGGIIVPPRSPSALAEAIQRLLLLTDDERARMGLTGRGRIVEQFSTEHIVSKYERLYDELAEQ